MTQFNHAKLFRQSCLAAAVSMFAVQSIFALEDLSDASLAETTGEGIALALPKISKWSFRGQNDVSASSSYNKAGLVDPSKYDTGFIRDYPCW